MGHGLYPELGGVPLHSSAPVNVDNEVRRMGA